MRTFRTGAGNCCGDRLTILWTVKLEVPDGVAPVPRLVLAPVRRGFGRIFGREHRRRHLLGLEDGAAFFRMSELALELDADVSFVAPNDATPALWSTAGGQQQGETLRKIFGVFELKFGAQIGNIGDDAAVQSFRADRNPRRITKLAAWCFAFVAVHLDCRSPAFTFIELPDDTISYKECSLPIAETSHDPTTGCVYHPIL